MGGLSLGGAESRIMDLYRNIDREEMQFDFLVHSAKEEHFDNEIKVLGGNVYRIPRFKVYNWASFGTITVVQASPLSSSKTFSSPQKETPYALSS